MAESVEHTYVGRNGTWFGYDAGMREVRIEGELDGAVKVVTLDGADLVEFVLEEVLRPALRRDVDTRLDLAVRAVLGGPPPVPKEK